jgi:predicted nuclease with RNAse H fold
VGITAYIGVDVQAARGCPYVILNAALQYYSSGWLQNPQEIRIVVSDVARTLGPVAVGIDAPRCPLPRPRSYYWQKGAWRERKPSEKGYGRHCEVVLAALKIANPQYTPPLNACPEWMRTGFELFEALSAETDVYEVFPSASYKLLANEDDAVFSISLRNFAAGPKDMLDAYVAAFTVHEYLAGKGMALGGEDGFGVIILPRPIRIAIPDLLQWPVR